MKTKIICFGAWIVSQWILVSQESCLFTGVVVDGESQDPIPARVYVRDETGKYHFVDSADPNGRSVRYQKTNWNNANSVEWHSTVSAHPFQIRLPFGRYEITVARGKEYVPFAQTLDFDKPSVRKTIPLRRWIHMSELGWHSGDTHVHREIEDLKNVALAEDLNVSFPLVYWVTEGFKPPSRGNKNLAGEPPSELIELSPNHVIYPRNTEYEIFTIGGKRHTLGAFFLLNHRSIFDRGAPPVVEIAERAHREGALIDLDKHDWPWSLALIPLMNVDLFELANNHMWRTEFAFTNWTTRAAAYMGLPNDGKRGGERDWIEYGFQTYYALLNCGFPLRPTAGTANGVHPVPLGFSRVYVHLDGGFDYESWVQGLNAGRSFVTTGPMLFVRINGRMPGESIAFDADETPVIEVEADVRSLNVLESVEVIVNGSVEAGMQIESNDQKPPYQSKARFTLPIETSGWAVVRCWTRTPEGRPRFAHTAPFYFTVPGKPLRPARLERDFLIRRVEEEIDRSRGILPESAMKEYETALGTFRAIRVREEE